MTSFIGQTYGVECVEHASDDADNRCESVSGMRSAWNAYRRERRAMVLQCELETRVAALLALPESSDYWQQMQVRRREDATLDA